MMLRLALLAFIVTVSVVALPPHPPDTLQPPTPPTDTLNLDDLDVDALSTALQAETAADTASSTNDVILHDVMHNPVTGALKSVLSRVARRLPPLVLAFLAEVAKSAVINFVKKNGWCHHPPGPPFYPSGVGGGIDPGPDALHPEDYIPEVLLKEYEEQYGDFTHS